jgi:hypothetical protein
VKEIGGDSRSGTTIHGGCAILFSIPFLAAGALIAVASTGAFGTEGMNAPPWVIAAAGAIFFFAGLFVAVHGVIGTARASAVRRRAALHPDEPWRADHPWNPREARYSAAAKALKGIPGMLFLCLFLTPFNYIAFFVEEVPWIVAGVIGLFDLLVLLGFGVILYKLAQGLKYGTGRLVLDRFPFFLGGPLEGRFKSGAPIEAESISLTLRCVQERYETRSSGRNSQSRVVRYELWSESRSVGGGSRVMEFPVSFQLPEGELGTCLADRPPRYWELEVTAKTPGVDYHALFLVPVYKRDN